MGQSGQPVTHPWSSTGEGRGLLQLGGAHLGAVGQMQGGHSSWHPPDAGGVVRIVPAGHGGHIKSQL